ncbi:MAG: cyclic nucleotide-binding domain-containing protein, partial [Clostridia bacterium]|nr:cyclic nucleotide-binding domain-containing protein [Clostridia bacterium]
MQEKLFNKGDVIFNKGETGDTFYRVIAGSVEIVDDGKQLVVLNEGQYFGEMAILEAYPRSATAIALEDRTRLEEISESDANNYFSEEPEKVLGFFCHLSDRLRALTNDYNAAVNALENISGKEGQPRDKGLFDKLGKALGGLFSRSPKNEISAETRKFIESADFTKGASLYVEEYAPGTVIFREG